MNTFNTQVGGTPQFAPSTLPSKNVLFGVHFSHDAIGGFIEVPNIAFRNDIPIAEELNSDKMSSGRRKLGMIVYTANENKYFQLVPLSGNSTGATKRITFNDWETATDAQKMVWLDPLAVREDIFNLNSTGDVLYGTNNPDDAWLELRVSGWDSAFVTVSSVSASKWDNDLVRSYVDSAFLPLTGGIVHGDLTVHGNFFATGSSALISAVNLEVKDSLIYLASDNPSDSLDIGFIGSFTESPVGYQHTGLVRLHDSNEWNLFSGLTTEPLSSAAISRTDPSFKLDTLKANIKGNLLTNTNVFGYLSSTSVVYASGGNSDNWNAAFSAVSSTILQNTFKNDTTFSGTLSSSGTVYASGGSFSGTLSSSGTLYASGGSFSGTVYASGGSFSGALSSSGIVYASGGNSTQWNSVYTTVFSNSSTNWNNNLVRNYVDTTFLPVSGGTTTGAIYVPGGNSNLWNSAYTTVQSTSSNWNSAYTTVTANSAAWINSASGKYLPLSGGTITGSLSVNQEMLVGDDPGVATLFVSDVATVGINTENPNETLTVVGTISSSQVIYALGGNSNLWNSSYSNVVSNSAAWINSASGKYLPLSGGSLTGTLSTAGEGNSSQWNSAYTTVTANSAAWINSASGKYLPLSGGTTTGAIYVPGGNSNLWNSAYTSVQSTSSNWDSTYTTVNAGYPTWNKTTANLQDLSGNWQSNYTTMSSNSAKWETAYSTVSNTILDGGNLLAKNLSIGSKDQYNLTFVTSNSSRITILSGGYVGIGTSSPNCSLTVSGDISANALKLSSSTTSASGILFGTDVNLYRSGAGILKTDSNVSIGGNLTPNLQSGTSSDVVIADPWNTLQKRSINTQVWNTGDTFLRSNNLTFSANYIPKAADNVGTMGNSAIYQWDVSGGRIGINTQFPSERLAVNGSVAVSGNVIASDFIFRRTPIQIIDGDNSATPTLYTFKPSDQNYLLAFDYSQDFTAMIPSSGFPIGAEITFLQYGMGFAYLSGSGILIRSANSRNRLRTQYSTASIIQMRTNEWLLFGDIWLNEYDI